MPEQNNGKPIHSFPTYYVHTRNCSHSFSIDGKGSPFIFLFISSFHFSLDNLVEFTPFQARFTNLGATGRYGPTTLGAHYVGQDHEHMVTVANGIQFWTVPYSGTYRITIVGAAGGYDSAGAGARGKISFSYEVNM